MAGLLPTLTGLAVLFGVVGYHHYRDKRIESRIPLQWRDAQLAVTEKRWADAERLFRALIKQWPTCGAFHSGLGISLAQQDQPQEAEQALRLGADLEPNSSDPHLNLALFYARFCPERGEDAAIALKRAILNEPELHAKILHDKRFAPFLEHPAFAPLEGGPPPRQ